MITIGTDFHKKTSSFHVINEDGQKLKSCKLENSHDNIRNFIQSLPGPKRLAVEATRNWGLFYDTVHDLVDEFHLGHPKKMKAITEAEIKNDARDAEMIARLTHSGFLPTAHVSCLDTRQLRTLLRFRYFLVTHRRSIRNQVQILLDRNLWPNQRPRSFKNPFCQKGRRWLTSLDLPVRERFILDYCLQSFDETNQKISDLENFIQSQSVHLDDMKFLRTVPGFRLSKVNAFIVLLEIDNIKRFHKARGFACYAGLIPREYSSGDRHCRGRLIKGANTFLRTALIESVLVAARVDKGLKAYYKSVKERSGSSAAIIATARKVAYAVYHVLKEQRPYRPESIQPSAAALIPCAAPVITG